MGLVIKRLNIKSNPQHIKWMLHKWMLHNLDKRTYGNSISPKNKRNARSSYGGKLGYVFRMTKNRVLVFQTHFSIFLEKRQKTRALYIISIPFTPINILQLIMHFKHLF